MWRTKWQQDRFFFEYFYFPPAIIIPPVFHTHHLRIALTRRTILGTFRKAVLFRQSVGIKQKNTFTFFVVEGLVLVAKSGTPFRKLTCANQKTHCELGFVRGKRMREQPKVVQFACRRVHDRPTDQPRIASPVGTATGNEEFSQLWHYSNHYTAVFVVS